MINLKKQAWRTGALCLAGVVALSVTGVSVYAKTSEKKETEVKEQIRDAVDDIWKSEDTSAASIDETVYVILNADGTQQKIYVSDWLKNQGEKDSYTQSNPDKEAPISLKVTYTLDGKEISPSDLNGQSGHVVIRYDYTNELYETREIAGKEEKIYVPFAVMTGMILDNDNFSNIKVSSGKVINDGSHSVVTGIVFPGLGTNLDMEEDFDDYLEIEADATDFTMNESYCIATNSVFSRLDFSNVDDLDDLTEAMDDLKNGLGQLTAQNDTLNGAAGQVFDTLLKTAASQLTAAGLTLPEELTISNYATILNALYQQMEPLSDADVALGYVLQQAGLTIEKYQSMVQASQSVSSGDAALQANLKTIQDKATSLSQAAGSIAALKASLDGYNQFYTGLQTYTAGVASASAGASKLADGSAQVVAGASQLKDGADKLADGSKELYDGADTLVEGARDLASGSGKLANGVNELSDGSDKLIDGISQLKDGSKELKDGMIEYNDEAISKLTDMDTDELQEVIDRMKATSSVSENYNSFTGDNNGMDSSVKFIYKINAVK